MEFSDLSQPDIDVDKYEDKSIAELVATTKSINEKNNIKNQKKIHSNDPAVFVSLRAHSSIPYSFTDDNINTFQKPIGIQLVKLTAAENGGMNSSNNINYQDKNDIILRVIEEDKASIIKSAETIQQLIRKTEQENKVDNFAQRNVVTIVKNIERSKNKGKMLNKQITPYSTEETQERNITNYMPINTETKPDEKFYTQKMEEKLEKLAKIEEKPKQTLPSLRFTKPVEKLEQNQEKKTNQLAKPEEKTKQLAKPEEKTKQIAKPEGKKENVTDDNILKIKDIHVNVLLQNQRNVFTTSLLGYDHQ